MNVINYNYGKYSRAICGADYQDAKIENSFHDILRRKNIKSPLLTIKGFFGDAYTLSSGKEQLERMVTNLFSTTPEWKDGEKHQMENFIKDFKSLMTAAYLLPEIKDDSFGSVNKVSKHNLVPEKILARNAKLNSVWDFFPCVLDHAEILSPLATIRSIKELIELEALKRALTDWENVSNSSSTKAPQKILVSLFFVHTIFHCLLEACHLIFVRELDSSEAGVDQNRDPGKTL